MNRRQVQIPEGMQDTLPGECAQKRRIEAVLRALFVRHGFAEAKTPQLEYYDVFTGSIRGMDQQQMWKTFDRNGNILVVRPDNTTPMVRMATTKMKDAPLPLRLCYVQDALHYAQHSGARFCEATQAGVELMGASGAEADAEIIALAIEALRSAGLKDFQIDIGQVDFFKGLMQEAGLCETDSEELRAYVEQKDMLGIELLLRRKDVSEEVSRRIMRLPMLYGGAEVLAMAEGMTKSPTCLAATQSLRTILSILEEYGLAEYVSIDLGMVQAIHYYSGMILRGITQNLGTALLSGGRYDDLPEGFGQAMPAVGFALDIKQLLIALERQGMRFTAPAGDILLGYVPKMRKQALNDAEALRAQGQCVELCYEHDAQSVARLAAQKGIAKALFRDEEGLRTLPCEQEGEHG